MPAAWNHSAMSLLSAAAPEMKKRTRPPKRSRTLLKTSLSKSPCWTLSTNGTFLPSRTSLSTSRPTLNAWLKSFSFRPPSAACMVTIRPCAFSKMRGAAPMKVGFTTPEVLDDLVDPAVDRGREAAGELGREQHLAERVGHRQPQELQVVLVEDVLDVDGLALVDPGLVPQPDALGPAGGAGGVDQRGELVGLDRLDRGRHRAGVLDEELLAEVGELVQRDDPVTVARAVEGDDLADARDLALALVELGQLLVVLDEDDLALGVAQDVGRVLGVRRRVDGRGGAAGAHDRQVREDPLVARAGGDADPLLGLDAERQQARGQAGDPVARLLPGDGRPRLADGVAERLVAGVLRHSVEEHDGHARLQVVDEAGVVVDRHDHSCGPWTRVSGSENRWDVT